LRCHETHSGQRCEHGGDLCSISVPLTKTASDRDQIHWRLSIRKYRQHRRCLSYFICREQRLYGRDARAFLPWRSSDQLKLGAILLTAKSRDLIFGPQPANSTQSFFRCASFVERKELRDDLAVLRSCWPSIPGEHGLVELIVKVAQRQHKSVILNAAVVQ